MRKTDYRGRRVFEEEVNLQDMQLGPDFGRARPLLYTEVRTLLNALEQKMDEEDQIGDLGELDFFNTAILHTEIETRGRESEKIGEISSELRSLCERYAEENKGVLPLVLFVVLANLAPTKFEEAEELVPFLKTEKFRFDKKEVISAFIREMQSR
eukprot:TRINITY_DN2730_c1_g4_i1.p1 TRINITY_DN2730_c1_g4~~TRINITY_DN2730_c1_g4_i1.p1  ORF type:complete len:155 (+),score=46.05 TRINITY_DN2730_c1_g4_i1:288-752(+)